MSSSDFGFFKKDTDHVIKKVRCVGSSEKYVVITNGGSVLDGGRFVSTGGSRGIGLMIAKATRRTETSFTFLEKKDACLWQRIDKFGTWNGSVDSRHIVRCGCKELCGEIAKQEENRCSRNNYRCYLGISIRDLSRDGMGKSDRHSMWQCL